MSDHVIGIVAKITSKEAGKNNNLIYNLCIEEEGREDEWYGYGWDEPDFTEGAEIEFDLTWNGDYANVDVDTVNVIADGEPKRSSGGRSNSRGSSRSSSNSGGGGGRSSSRSSGSSRGSSSQSRGKSSSSSSRGSSNRGSSNKGKGKGAADTTMSKDEWKQKDNMIRRQACMNTAINLIGLMQTAGVLPKPKTKSDGFDALAALCDEEAIRLYDQYEEQVYGGATSKRGKSSQNEPEYDDDIPE